MYPIRANEQEVIAKSTNEQVKNITKYKVAKLQCYAAISSIFVLSDEKLFIVDSALRKAEQIAVKVRKGIYEGARLRYQRVVGEEGGGGALNRSGLHEEGRLYHLPEPYHQSLLIVSQVQLE